MIVLNDSIYIYIVSILLAHLVETGAPIVHSPNRIHDNKITNSNNNITSITKSQTHKSLQPFPEKTKATPTNSKNPRYLDHLCPMSLRSICVGLCREKAPNQASAHALTQKHAGILPPIPTMVPMILVWAGA